MLDMVLIVSILLIFITWFEIYNFIKNNFIYIRRSDKMIGIYKITNKINNKSYIGQSIHIERRWSEHCFPSKTSQISLAIQEFGKEKSPLSD